jgi:hypothetical protein
MPRRKRVSGIHPMKRFLNFTAWLTGILVSLSVGFAMIGDGTYRLLLPSWLGGAMASMVVGWIIVIITFIGIITAIFSK